MPLAPPSVEWAARAKARPIDLLAHGIAKYGGRVLGGLAHEAADIGVDAFHHPYATAASLIPIGGPKGMQPGARGYTWAEGGLGELSTALRAHAHAQGRPVAPTPRRTLPSEFSHSREGVPLEAHGEPPLVEEYMAPGRLARFMDRIGAREPEHVEEALDYLQTNLTELWEPLRRDYLLKVKDQPGRLSVSPTSKLAKAVGARRPTAGEMAPTGENLSRVYMKALTETGRPPGPRAMGTSARQQAQALRAKDMNPRGSPRINWASRDKTGKFTPPTNPRAVEAPSGREKPGDPNVKFTAVEKLPDGSFQPYVRYHDGRRANVGPSHPTRADAHAVAAKRYRRPPGKPKK